MLNLIFERKIGSQKIGAKIVVRIDNQKKITF